MLKKKKKRNNGERLETVVVAWILYASDGGSPQWDPAPSQQKIKAEKAIFGTSLVAQWLRTRRPMQGTRVWALVREDPTCHGATKPMRHSYWACALEPVSHNYWSPRA